MVHFAEINQAASPTHCCNILEELRHESLCQETVSDTALIMGERDWSQNSCEVLLYFLFFYLFIYFFDEFLNFFIFISVYFLFMYLFIIFNQTHVYIHI